MTLYGNEIQEIIYDGGRSATVQVIDESTRTRKRFGDPVWLPGIPLTDMPSEWLRKARTAIDAALQLAA